MRHHDPRPSSTGDRTPVAVVLLAAAGIALLGIAALYNELLLARVDPSPPLLASTVEKIRSSQLVYLALGIGALLAAVAFARWAPLRARAARPFAAKLVLAVVLLPLPLVVLELAGRPFAEPKTTVFVRDPELGWKLRPGAEDEWLGVRIRVNDKGLRGPELAYQKPSGVRRILYLGDSVTFGAYLDSHELTFPYLVERALEHRAAGRTETIAAGVGGYSPWQEYLYLAGEGARYAPDVVVVGFVLNDVLEESYWRDSGRRVERFQLSRTAASTWDRLASRSGLVYLARRIGRRVREGSPAEARAPHRRELTVRSLAEDPDRPDVLLAWESAFESLDKIAAWCRQHEVPMILVIFPSRFQLDEPSASSAPQTALLRYAQARRIPAIDLLPALSRGRPQRGEAPRDYFTSETHLSATGHARAAEIIGDFMLQNVLAPRSQSPGRSKPIRRESQQ